jgi:RNA polymerase sigma-70 factor, ECF subfamily
VDQSEHELAVRLRAGDAAVARDLYRAYGRLVFAVAHRVLGNQTLAEDATQQAFMQAWNARASVDASRGIRAWLCAIAQRAAIDVHRRETRHTHESFDSERPTLEPVAEPSHETAWEVWRVREAVAALPAEERIVVHLQHFRGYQLNEIAEQLGLPVGTVKSRAHRAHRRLVSALGAAEEMQIG